MRVGEGWGVLLQEGGTVGKQLYPTLFDVQTQRAFFLPRRGGAQVDYVLRLMQRKICACFALALQWM